jgi:lipoyl synthase
MTPADTPDLLFTRAMEAQKNGAGGLLLSGGCDPHGRMLNLGKLLPTIKRIKRETDLIIKLHTGLVDRTLAEGIVEAEVDVASMEFVGDDDSIKEVFGLDLGLDAYIDTFQNLRDAGMKNISPHVCVGIHRGELRGEFNALNLIKEHVNPDSLVIIVFRPTNGTPMGSLPSPTGQSVGRVVAHARKLFPEKKILLGSLRPRTADKGRSDEDDDTRLGIELAALDHGIDAIEIPSPGLVKIMRERGHLLKRIEAFGVLPGEYEESIGYRWE